VRVPTHEEGVSLFWEFATDSYDIGFGLYFEWTVAENNNVTVHVSESDEDEDEFEGGMEGAGGDAGVEGGASPRPGGGAGGTGGVGDVESGGGIGAGSPRPRDPNKPRVDEIIPVFRRESHMEVFAGSHAYPGVGVYLLKFDNSYSLWRSKTLYVSGKEGERGLDGLPNGCRFQYRVYYSK